MSAIRLPPEVLLQIFKHLDGVDLLSCRAVNTSWKEAVDSIKDTKWHKFCENDYMFIIYKKIHKTSSMSWRDTFIAFHSWANINSAKMECHQLPESFVQRFKILPNRMIVVLANSKPDSDSVNSDGLCDTVVHYNIDKNSNFQEVKRKIFETPFYGYDENEHFYVILFKNSELLVVHKASNLQKVVGKVYTVGDFWRMQVQQFCLLENRVYFQNENYKICYSTLKETKTGNAVIKTKLLEFYDENSDGDYDEIKHVIAFGCRDGNLTLLTYEGYLYEYDTDEFCMMTKFRRSTTEVISLLNEFGIDWAARSVYLWLLGMFNNIETSRIAHVSYYMHGPVILLGALKGHLVHLFYNKEGGLFSYKAKPTMTIDMKKLTGIPKDDDCVIQIDIVEAPDHHLVILLSGQRLFLVKFGFDVTDKTGPESGNGSIKVPAKREALQQKSAKEVKFCTRRAKIAYKPSK